MHHLFGWTGLCVAEIFSVDLGHLSKYSRAHLFVYVTFVGDRGTERQGLSLGIVLDGSNFASKFGHFLMFVPLDFFFFGFLPQMVNASLHRLFGRTGFVLLRFSVSTVGSLVAVDLSPSSRVCHLLKDRESDRHGFSMGTVGCIFPTLSVNYHPKDSVSQCCI